MHKAFLLHTEERCLSLGKWLVWLLELQAELATFLIILFLLETKLQLFRLGKLVGIFLKIKEVSSTSSRTLKVFVVNDKILAFKQKLGPWKTCIYHSV